LCIFSFLIITIGIAFALCVCLAFVVYLSRIESVGTVSAAPALIAAEACVLCASHADADRMLFCADCDEAFHVYCLFPGTTTINGARYVWWLRAVAVMGV
jgi:hypothetical protein